MAGKLHPQSAAVSSPPGSIPHIPAPTHDNDQGGEPPNKEVSPFSAAVPESSPPAAVCSPCSPVHQNPAPQVSRAMTPVKSCRPRPLLLPASPASLACPFPRPSGRVSRSCTPAAPCAALCPRSSVPHRPGVRLSPTNQDSFPLRRFRFYQHPSICQPNPSKNSCSKFAEVAGIVCRILQCQSESRTCWFDCRYYSIWDCRFVSSTSNFLF